MLRLLAFWLSYLLLNSMLLLILKMVAITCKPYKPFAHFYILQLHLHQVHLLYNLAELKKIGKNNKSVPYSCSIFKFKLKNRH